MMLLFVFVFGSAIQIGGGSYVDYLLPGILLITVASGIAYTAFRLFTDVSGGISNGSSPCRSPGLRCCGATC